jgi:hypothetical protein
VAAAGDEVGEEVEEVIGDAIRLMSFKPRNLVSVENSGCNGIEEHRPMLDHISISLACLGGKFSPGAPTVQREDNFEQPLEANA